MKVVQLFIVAFLLSFAANSQNTPSLITTPVRYKNITADTFKLPIGDTSAPKTDGRIVRLASGLFIANGSYFSIIGANGVVYSGGSSIYLLFNNRTGSYSLSATDTGKLVSVKSATPSVVVVPPHSSVPFPVGTQILIAQDSTGQVSIMPGTNVIVNASDSLKLRSIHSKASLVQRAIDQWDLVGDLVQPATFGNTTTAYFSGAAQAIVNGLILTGLQDPYTGENVSYTQRTITPNGVTITDALIDSVIVIKKNGLYYYRNYVGSPNIKWYGVKGDAATDETYNWQKAIRAVAKLTPFNSPQDPTKIVVPEGTYKITGNGIRITTGITMEGNGRVIFDLSGLNSNAYAFSLIDSANQVRKTTISGFTFDDPSTSGNKNGIYIASHDNVITGNKFTRLNEGIKVDGYNGNIIEKNIFVSHKLGIYLLGFASQTYIEHNNFFSGASNGIASIKLNDATSPYALQSVFITDNWFEGNVAIPDILGRLCSNVYISKFWAEDYAALYTSPRIDIDQLSYEVGNISISDARIVVRGGTPAAIKVKAGSAIIEKLDISQQNEVPTIDLTGTRFAKLNNIRFNSIENELEGLGYGVNIKGGFKVLNEDIEEGQNKLWSIGGIQTRAGKNIFFDSDFKNGTNLVTGGAIPPTVVLDTIGFLDKSSVKITIPTSGPYASNVRTAKGMSVNQGDNIRIAFWAKTDGAPHRINAQLAGTAALGGQDIYLTNQWKRFYIGFDSVTVTGGYYLYLRTGGLNAPLNVWIDKIQGETGSITDYSAYVPNETASDEITINKGIQIPEFNIGQSNISATLTRPTTDVQPRGSIKFNQAPINGGYAGYISTVSGAWSPFGAIESLGLTWLGMSANIAVNDTMGLTYTGSGSSFGNVAHSAEIFSPNNGVLTAQNNAASYSVNSQEIIGFANATNFTTWTQMIIGAYWSPTGFEVVYGGAISADIPGVGINDYIRIRPTSVNTYIDKSTDGITWTVAYTPPTPIILTTTYYAAVDFNGTGGTKSINNITQSSDGQFPVRKQLQGYATKAYVNATISTSGTLTTGYVVRSGDGTTNFIDIIELPTTPTWVGQPTGMANISWAEPIANGIRVHFSVTPAAGTNNIKVYYSYK